MKYSYKLRIFFNEAKAEMKVLLEEKRLMYHFLRSNPRSASNFLKMLKSNKFLQI